MAFELKLVKVTVIERAELRCQTPKRPDQRKLCSDDVDDETERDATRELEASLGLALRLGQSGSSRKKIRVQVVAAICRASEVSCPVRGVERTSHKLLPRLDVLPPRYDTVPEAQIDASLIAMPPVLLHQIVAQLAKLKSGLIVPETRPQRQRYVRVARCIAIAMLEAETDHPTKHESMKVLIGEHRRHHDLGENIQNIEHIGIGHQGQVDQFFDLASSQGRPDLLVFP